MLYISGVSTIIMFVVVMFWANPTIDKQKGFGVLSLQLAFSKEYGINIVNSWGKGGVERFTHYIISDYIYALSYSFFLALLLFQLKSRIYFLPLVAGLFDWVENSMEILFTHDMIHFSTYVFFLHSLIASLKWLIVPIVFYNIFKCAKEGNYAR